MRLHNKSFVENSVIKLKNNEWLKKYRIAGNVAANTLTLLESLIKDKTIKSLLELDKIAEEFIIKNGCTPTFLGYKNFPNACCISVNSQLVHGIPTNYKLKDGDLVSFDLGATFEGAIGDTAITCLYGNAKKEEHIRLINATKEALINGINSIKIGKRLGCIGNAISKCANQYGFSVVSNYGGHGICSDNEYGIPHTAPFVSNKDVPENGIRFQPGMVIAIEPLFVVGRSSSTKILNDSWTVVCEDICAHFEHSIFIHEDYVEILTNRN